MELPAKKQRYENSGTMLSSLVFSRIQNYRIAGLYLSDFKSRLYQKGVFPVKLRKSVARLDRFYVDSETFSKTKRGKEEKRLPANRVGHSVYNICFLKVFISPEMTLVLITQCEIKTRRHLKTFSHLI